MQLHLPYRSPLGLPLRWQDDQSGKLPSAVMAFIDSLLPTEVLALTDGRTEPVQCSDEQLEYVRAYCQYYVEAPCYTDLAQQDEESRAELQEVREQIKTVKTAQELHKWICRCLMIPIDPL